MGRLIKSSCVALIALIAVAGAARAGWEDDLREDARIFLDCEVAFLTQVIVRTFRDKTIINAKVHCEDKRAFDAAREEDEEPFIFTECVDPNARQC